VDYDKESDHPLVTLENITLRVGRELMFENTSWEIQADQHWAIIGPNGSGKSTLANAICHEVAIVHGRILYFFDQDGRNVPQARPYFNRGEIVKISPEAHRDLMQTQGGYYQARWQSFEGTDSPTVADLLTGKSIERICPYDVSPMKINQAIYHVRRQKAVALLGIAYLLERKILHVSNGEAQKVLLARALMQAPKLLILDDPFRGLDSSSRAALQRVIADLIAAGSPRLILITPRSEEILPGITHILCVADNRVVKQGPKHTILPTKPNREMFPSQEQTTSNPPFRFPAALRETIDRPSILVELQNTTVAYNGVKVLHGINWTMRHGENWAVLGPNGAGKTTLLSLILADNPQSYANVITLFGRQRGSGESIWDIKQNIGWISPELQIYYQRDLPCHQVVCSGFFDSIGLYQACSPEQADLAAQWLHALGLAPLADRPLSTVSVGEERLVLLARALVKNPALLILDEPCQGLDVHNRTRIIDLLDQLCRATPVNLIYVTHHFDELPQAITHVLKLDRGRIQERGTRQGVLGW